MRFRLSGLLLSGVVVASSACSDVSITSPLAASESAGLSRSSDRDTPTPSVSTDDNVESYTFSVDPTRPNHLQFGAHSLDLPAHAVCAEGSGYGAEWWDMPCATSRSPMRISVVVRGASKGLPRVDLLPAVRFNPATTVTLELYVKRLPKSMATYDILYCETFKTTCVDESLTDPTLVPSYDRPAHTLSRRIKHFSGYLVAERQ